MNNYRSTLLNSLHMITHSAVSAALWVLVLAASMLLQACGGGTEFRINGEIDNFGTGNLRLIFYSYDAVRSVTATAVDGKFMALSRTQKPTVIRIYTSAGKLVGRLVIDNGQTVDVKFDITDPTVMKVSGNRDSERLADFLKENADAIKNGDTSSLNAAVEKIVEKNPKWMLSGLLMTDFYDTRVDPQKALAIMTAIEPAVVRDMQLTPLRQQLMPLVVPFDSIAIPTLTLFTQADTIRTFSMADNTNTLLMFTTAEQRENDTIVGQLAYITKPSASRTIGVIDISADPDTTVWHLSVDSLSFKSPALTHAWSLSPATIPELSPLTIRTYPWFILTDSTGTPLYSGPSISAIRPLLAD